ncbi:Ornithine carbamoyltransferase [Thermodesulfobacterium geofontis OPF15]|uniref:Ornithine carbamoyltransferase n=1 Tax=Thermodesulfobacterium geofontis (strain OPF15) TaxID=795359 RepID=F8C450_THEGP|nr:ornithine carbamoyltransferase [Thermodesulfobacterium geofontis]AEH23710.1 Ornithine carbamoyltransferase [Thermodesulfobacterium geofontis OPF15]
MKRRHFIRIWDLKKEEALGLINRALELKRNKNWERKFIGKILGLIFEKPSTRTRISFESAMIKWGGSSIFLSSKDLQLSRGEPIKDTARVISRYIDILVLRTYKQETIEEFAKYSSIPVINGLSDRFHPCQVLSDIMTVIEKGKDLYKDKIVWIGDGNNVAQSWIEASALLGFKLVLACPKGFEPEEELLKEAKEIYKAQIEIVNNPEEAIKGAEVINTDVWTSMGQEEESEKRRFAFKNFQVNNELLKLADPSAIVLHCLPAHRDEEITEEVLEGHQSVVWDQAENKMWLHMALIEFLLER